MSGQFWWYLTRSSGIVAWMLLTASVLCGILVPARFVDGQRPAWFLDLHRWLASLTLGFLGLHLVALVADSYVHFDLLDLLVPFAAGWRPGAVALGVAAAWGLVVVQVTSLLRSRLSRRVWRSVHLASYAAFFATSLHATLAGTDVANPIYQVASIAALVAVTFATVFRVLTRRRRTGRTAPDRGAAPGSRAVAGPAVR